LRQSADGVLIYTESGVREVTIPLSKGRPGRADVLDEMYQAIVHDVASRHDGRFARGTLEVCLAIQESSRTRREVALPMPRAAVASSSKPRDDLNLADAASP
jgi:phthalate 4,5-cis-dihydrodiol dehydrogenase